ncbi:hypothetical protein [Clostridium botulinum]|uniref:hypothetical protein n=1 Tax=Clostridium botulinum TaxID=1491 RepID=UPI001C9AB684|nr:hypothetical protein [Clostridium botulinum]MBY6842821.1 hypothetical protein [Clostridium botulinum]
MIKCFKKNYQNKWYEIRVLNTETGEFIFYHQTKEMGFPFGKPYKTTVAKMGYKDTKHCLKELKNRGLLGKEINLEEQQQSEKTGYINLGVERIRRTGRINTNDFKDVIEKLNNYSLVFVDAQNAIIEAYLHSI